MKITRLALLSCLFVGLDVVASARGSVVSWGTVTPISGPGTTTVTTAASAGGPGVGNTITNGTNDVITAGSQVFGLNYTGPANVSYPYDDTIGATVFHSFRDGGGSTASTTQGAINYSATGVVNSYTGFSSVGTAGQSYGYYTQNCCIADPDYLLSNAAYSNDNHGSFTFTGLTPGDNYSLQFWVDDPRSCCNGRSETISGSGSDVSGSLFYGTSPTSDGEFVVGTFRADGTGAQTFTLLGSPNPGNPADTTGSAQVNLLQLRDLGVPEPASLSLLGIAGLGLLVRRRT